MAVIWWRKAAEQDFAPAQFNLGSALMEGFGTPRDRAAGLSWHRRAAANGHPQAQRSLELHKDTAPRLTPNLTRVPPPRPHSHPRPRPRPRLQLYQRYASHSRQQCKTAEYTTGQNRSQSTRAGRNCAIRRLQRLARSGYQHAHRAAHGQPDRGRSTRLRRAARTDWHRHLQLSIKSSRWYALLYGRYDSADDARTALEALPGKVRAGGGYVRRISTIRHAVVKP